MNDGGGSDPRDRPPFALTAARPQILVVDDEPFCGALIDRILRHDHDVTVVAGGIEALALVRGGHAYDVILCDLSMPRVTGEDVFRALCTEAPEQAARVVFVTGGAVNDAAARFLATVADRVLYKPFNRGELMSWIAAAMGAHGAAAAMVTGPVPDAGGPVDPPLL